MIILIKHRDYIVFVLLIAMMFIIFQMLFLNISWNDNWAINKSMDGLNISKSGSSIVEKSHLSLKNYYVVSSDHDANNFNNIKKALELWRFSYNAYASLDDLPQNPPDELTGIIICDSNLDNIGDMDVLIKYLKSKVTVLFANRFVTSAENYIKYRRMFGIRSNSGSYTQKGVDFLGEILVSGIIFNARLEIQANRVELDGRCKMYACGYDETKYFSYEKNPIIWRTYYKDGGAMMFFNANFMDNFMAAGILSSALSANEDVFIYPIVNTSLVLVEGVPYFSTVGSENIRNVYMRSIKQFQYDVIWSDLIAITKSTDMQYTLYPTVGSGQDNLENDLLQYYGKDIYSNKYELGYYPSQLLKKVLPKYSNNSQMNYPNSDAQSVVVFDSADFGFANHQAVKIPVITQGHNISKANQFYSFSVASAFGYISHYLDINNDVFNRTDGVDVWTDYKLKFIQSIYGVIKKYEHLEKETVTSAAKKMNAYLNCVPEIRHDDEKIFIASQSVGTISYMLRTHRKIKKYEGCTVKNIEGNFYFVTVNDRDAVLYTEEG